MTFPWDGTCGLWKPTDKGDARCRALADSHYSRQTPGHPMFTRPGFNYVLHYESAYGEAAWCWWRPKWEDGRPGTQRKDGLECLECTLFAYRKRADNAPLASEFVRDAVTALYLPAAAEALKLARPQDMLLITGVSSGKTSERRSRRSLPGKCFREAGWEEMEKATKRADVWLWHKEPR